MPSTPSTEQLRLISDAARALEKADPCNGDRGRIVARLAETLNRSLNTTYNYLKKYGAWESGKKPRKGKGETCVPEALCRKVAEKATRSFRDTGKRIMSIKDAVKYWEANGEGIMDPETGEITMPSVETISRAMRRYGCHPDQLRAASPAVRMRTEYPNQAWQADASVCVLYRIPGSGKIGLVKEKSYNGKKPENLFKIRQNRIVRYLEVDHYSGNFYLRYEQAPGESAEGFLTTFIEAMTDRGPQDPMHGVPEVRYTDMGSGNTASLLRAAWRPAPAPQGGRSQIYRVGRKLPEHCGDTFREPPALSRYTGCCDASIARGPLAQAFLRYGDPFPDEQGGEGKNPQ